MSNLHLVPTEDAFPVNIDLDIVVNFGGDA